MNIKKHFICREGELVPWYMGLVHYDFIKNRYYFAPLGTNLIAQIFVWLYLSLRRGMMDHFRFYHKQKMLSDKKRANLEAADE